MSSVLKKSTSDTLKQYEDHIFEVQAEYVPHLEKFQALKPGECKDDAEYTLNRTASLSGYRIGNCATFYDNSVQPDIAIANRALARFDDLYGQVQSIVVKSFIGRNSFVDPESIQDRITEIYDIVKGRWDGSKPEIEAVRRNLASAIAAHNAQLDVCHENSLAFAQTYFGMFRELVDECAIFDNTPNPFGMSPKSKSKKSTTFDRANFEAAIDSESEFEWKKISA